MARQHLPWSRMRRAEFVFRCCSRHVDTDLAPLVALYTYSVSLDFPRVSYGH
jgi:hypothetical protein